MAHFVSNKLAHTLINATIPQNVSLLTWSIFQIKGAAFDIININFDKSLLQVSYISGQLAPTPTGSYVSILPGTYDTG
jgi:hypothetical protein